MGAGLVNFYRPLQMVFLWGVDRYLRSTMEYPGPMPPSGTSCLCYVMLSCDYVYMFMWENIANVVLPSSYDMYVYALVIFIPYVSCLLTHHVCLDFLTRPHIIYLANLTRLICMLYFIIVYLA